MQLTQDNIKKIDSFLQGIGVEYIDIRQEMVDHIASDIESNVEDSEFFFGDNRFQSVYLKYLLSKKAKYIKMYKTIVSKKTKSDLTQILKDVLNHLLKTPVLLFIIVLSYLFINYFKDSFVKELNIAVFLLVLAYIIYDIVMSHFFIKKYGSLKTIKTYQMITSFIVLATINFPNFINVFYDGNYSPNNSFVYLTCFFALYLINSSFYKRKESIVNYYSQTIDLCN